LKETPKQNSPYQYHGPAPDFHPRRERGYGRAIAVDRLTTAREQFRFGSIPAGLISEMLGSGQAIFQCLLMVN
jgi:hypothetical protein